jgi:hypothetical protein
VEILYHELWLVFPSGRDAKQNTSHNILNLLR